ncbi:hypothetical protein A2U01_0043822, partial [Trifolium medium]|nr:hypothetical protein [Trifolium medium]
MSKSTKSSTAKNNQGSPVPDNAPVSTVPAQEPRRVRTKSVAVRPKRIPIVRKSSNPSVSENWRMKLIAV